MSHFTLGGCQIGQVAVACNCSGRCKMWPFTCTGVTPSGDSVYKETSSAPPSDIVAMTRKLAHTESILNSHEHSINHNQAGIEKCVDRVEKIEYVLGDVHKEGTPLKIDRKKKPQKPYENIFEPGFVDYRNHPDIMDVKTAMYDLYCWILDNVPDNKYRSSGIDLLEAAEMQLTKSISRRKDDGTQERQDDRQSKRD